MCVCTVNVLNYFYCITDPASKPCVGWVTPKCVRLQYFLTCSAFMLSYYEFPISYVPHHPLLVTPAGVDAALAVEREQLFVCVPVCIPMCVCVFLCVCVCR